MPAAVALRATARADVDLNLRRRREGGAQLASSSQPPARWIIPTSSQQSAPSATPGIGTATVPAPTKEPVAGSSGALGDTPLRPDLASVSGLGATQTISSTSRVTDIYLLLPTLYSAFSLDSHFALL